MLILDNIMHDRIVVEAYFRIDHPYHGFKMRKILMQAGNHPFTTPDVPQNRGSPGK